VENVNRGEKEKNVTKRKKNKKVENINRGGKEKKSIFKSTWSLIRFGDTYIKVGALLPLRLEKPLRK